MTGDEVTGDEVTRDEVTGDEMTGDEVTGDEVTGDEVTGDEMTGNHIHQISRKNRWSRFRDPYQGFSIKQFFVLAHELASRIDEL
nr:hypothetical protein BgiMline_028442 [Biomphalaria glabrata]